MNSRAIWKRLIGPQGGRYFRNHWPRGVASVVYVKLYYILCKGIIKLIIAFNLLIYDASINAYFLPNPDIQGLRKVLRPLDLFHILLSYSLILKWIK